MSTPVVNRLSGINVGNYPRHRFEVIGGSAQHNQPLGLFASGWDDWVTGCFRKRENSTICALEYVTEGIFVFTRGKRRHELSSGGLFIVLPGDDITMKCITPKAQKRTVIFTGSLLPNLLESFGLYRNEVLIGNFDQRLKSLFDQADKLCAEKKSRITGPFVYQMLAEVAEMSSELNHPTHIGEILDYLHRHLNQPVSVSDICRKCAVSQAMLYRLFAAECLTTPVEYHARLRMNHASELLSSLDYSVKEVAAELGFSSPQYFATEFKKRFGYSPSHCKAQQK